MNAVGLVRYGDGRDRLRLRLWFGLWRLTAAEESADYRGCEQFEGRPGSLEDAVSWFLPVKCGEDFLRVCMIDLLENSIG